MTFTGKNTDFVVIFNCSEQSYKVYYKDNYMNIMKYKYSDIASYLN